MAICGALHDGLVMVHARKHTPEPVHLLSPTHTRTRARASERTPHTRPRTHKYVVLFFHGKVVL